MRATEAIFWSSYSAVASPSIQEEVFVQRSAPSTVWFTKSSSVPKGEGAPKVTRRQWLIAGIIYAGNFCAAMSFSLQAPFFPKKVRARRDPGVAAENGHGFLEKPRLGSSLSSGALRPLQTFAFDCAASPAICFSRRSRVLETFVPNCTFRSLFYQIIESFRITYVSALRTLTITSPYKTYGTAYSSLKTSFSVGMIVGPTVGGFLYDLGGYTTPFAVCGGLGLSSTLVTLFIIPNTVDKMDSGPTNLRHFWSGPMVYLYGLAIFGSYACAGFNSATMEPHLRQFNLSTTILGLVFMIPGLFNCAVMPVWGKLCDWKVNPKLLTGIGALFVLAYLLLIGPAPFLPFDTKLWLVIVSMASFGVGIGGASICAFMATLEYTLSRGFQPSIATNGLISSMFTLSQSIGSFTGPALGGLLLQHVGYRWGTLVLFSFEAVVVSAYRILLDTRTSCFP
ncbi:unnamed protein product, partial [Ixodes hexagonus]